MAVLLSGMLSIRKGRLMTEDFEFIEGAQTWHSGGGIMLDAIKLTDGTMLVISDDLIGHYKDWNAFLAGRGLFIDRTKMAKIPASTDN